MSFGICLSILGGGIYGISRIFEDSCHYDRYRHITTTYTSDGSVIVKDDLLSFNDAKALKYDNHIIVSIHESDYVFDNNEGDVISYVELDEDMKRVIESYSNKSVEVTRSFVDWDNVVDFHNKKEARAITILISCLYVGILSLIYGTSKVFYKDIYKIIGYIRDLKYEKDDIRVFSKTLKSIETEMLEIINSNEELRKLYMCLYEQNKHLIDNPTELYKRFEDLEKEFSLSSDEVKKLVRTKA